MTSKSQASSFELDPGTEASERFPSMPKTNACTPESLEVGACSQELDVEQSEAYAVLVHDMLT